MRLLLDTHVLLWLLDDPGELLAETRAALADEGNALAVSVASLWEIVVKVRTGKLRADVSAVARRLAPHSGVALLGITPAHLATMQALPRFRDHSDPVDLALVATAVSEGMTLVTRDAKLARYPVARLPC